jgi:hypothetical protein
VRLSDIVQRYLKEMKDSRSVVADAAALYFGARLDDSSLVPAAGARIGAIRFETWLAQQRPAK